MVRINGETLRKIRIAYKLTQSEIGALCNVTDAMINKIERGKYPMTDAVLLALNEELSLTAEKVIVLLAEYDRLMKRKNDARRRRGTA